MIKKSGFVAMNLDEFCDYLNRLTVRRNIRTVQIHHTYAPSYKEWEKNPDALYWQKQMKEYHVSSAGYNDIAQHFTICPDGMIVTGRDIENIPAGIKGANTGAICIENLGNFDSGGDTMKVLHANTIVGAVGELLRKFKLDTSAITYHCWWTAGGTALGDYIPGRSAKTCPGTAFFGGNTKAAFERGFKKKVEEYLNSEDIDMEELKKEIASLKAKVEKLEKPMIYNYIDDNMPQWAHEGVQWCLDNGIIQGTGEGLGLDDKDLKYCTMMMRLMRK